MRPLAPRQAPLTQRGAHICHPPPAAYTDSNARRAAEVECVLAEGSEIPGLLSKTYQELPAREPKFFRFAPVPVIVGGSEQADDVPKSARPDGPCLTLPIERFVTRLIRRAGQQSCFACVSLPRSAPASLIPDVMSMVLSQLRVVQADAEAALRAVEKTGFPVKTDPTGSAERLHNTTTNQRNIAKATANAEGRSRPETYNAVQSKPGASLPASGAPDALRGFPAPPGFVLQAAPPFRGFIPSSSLARARSSMPPNMCGSISASRPERGAKRASAWKGGRLPWPLPRLPRATRPARSAHPAVCYGKWSSCTTAVSCGWTGRSTDLPTRWKERSGLKSVCLGHGRAD